jgi:glycosyltransferase involved in cell wall biosynthesis
MKKVLIISYWFPPLNVIASLRIYAFAKYLREKGFETTVLTSIKKYPCGTENYIDTSQIPVVEVDFGITGTIDNVNNLRQMSACNSTFWAASLKTLVKYCEKIKNVFLGNFFTPEDFWFFKAMEEAEKLCSEMSFDVVISSSGPISSHVVAYLLKKKHPHLLWCSDYRDMWSYNDMFSRPKWPLCILQRKIEKRLNSKADCLITVSDPLREILAQDYKGKVVVIENGYFPEDLDIICSNDSVADDTLRIVHTGTIYEKYNLEPLLLAIGELIDNGDLVRDKIKIIFYGDNNYLLKGQIGKHGLSDVFILDGKISRKRSLLMQKTCSALLFLGYETPLTKGVLTGKIFEYIISGRPIIAAGITNACSAGKLIEETNTGYVCADDVELIKAVIKKIQKNEPFKPNEIVIAKYSRDKLVDRLVEILLQFPYRA